MDITSLAIPEVKLVRPARFDDPRGTFSETYNLSALRAAGIAVDFVQDNCSISKSIGTVRGLHFQSFPLAQSKFVTVLRGRVQDVVVDCRTGSPTYGRHVAIELNGAEWQQLFVPVGFAHGFCTLEPDTLVHYKVSAPYSPDLEGGIVWNDPDLNIGWAVAAENIVVSKKDKELPRWRDLASPFR
jgi:dTDP-4-dehydrorhamnose 3,5-epimerase